MSARDIDFFIDPDLETEIEGVGKIAGEFPYRAYDLVEFYKMVKSKNKIISISIDVEGHSISFHVGFKK